MTTLEMKLQNLELLEKKYLELLNDSKYKELIVFTQQSSHSKNINCARLSLHYQGMAMACQGAMFKARIIFEEALKLGENIQLLRDLACCYYQLNETDLWRNTYLRMKNVLENSRKLKLSFTARFSSQLTLAKFLEEEGQTGTALQIYEDLMSHHGITSPSKEFFQLSPQILRLKSHYETDINISKLYVQLASSCHENVSDYLGIEIEHALMLAELNLVGPEHAFERVQKALLSEINHIDKRLFCFDFIEECILKSFGLPSGLYDLALKVLPSASVFEKEVFAIAFENGRPSNLTKHNSLAKILPLGNYLRLLVLDLASPIDSQKKLEIKNKLNLILSGFEEDDKNFWQMRMRKFSMDGEMDLILDLKKRNIMYHHASLDFSRKRVAFQLLQLLLVKSHWGVDDVISSIWQANYSPEHFNRLRMSVHRTNQMLFNLTSFEKCIEINGENLALNPNVRLNNAQRTH